MISLYKNRELMAIADRVTLETSLSASDLPCPLHLFYFSRLVLSPPITFEHLAGAALMSFLDRTTMIDDSRSSSGALIDLSTGPLRYVHGKSEVMKGKPSITCVLLAHMGGAEVNDQEWAPLLPEIWHRFQAIRAEKNI